MIGRNERGEGSVAMAAQNPLTEQDLAAVRAELSEGKPVTVWFTAAAVGVAAGGSAKVVSIGDVAEGDFIQVRPAGSRDTMFCSPGELTRTRPPRKRAAQPPATQATGGESSAAKPSATPAPATPAPAAPPVEPPVTRQPATQRAQSVSQVEKEEPAPTAKGTSRSPSPPADKRSRSTRPAEVIVTLNSTADGEWTVEVVTGKKRTVRPTPVQPADVAKAARVLPTAVAEAIESSLDAARRRQVERVERLRAELDAAQRALQELSS
jgi:Family of unknown function (DUF6319)